jgi:hypothetical protein
MKSRTGFISNSSSSSFVVLNDREPDLYEKAFAAVVEDLVGHGHSYEEAYTLATIDSEDMTEAI